MGACWLGGEECRWGGTGALVTTPYWAFVPNALKAATARSQGMRANGRHGGNG